MKRIWFKAKRYGYGWYPAAWQGWLILAVFVILTVRNVLQIDVADEMDGAIGALIVVHEIILVAILIFICWLTGEKAAWRWGEQNRKS
ncbi:MAG TPA: hypothetical protein VG941_00565 [Candidatus Paceibacterota bacterium]|nr:hypothetical protein [Candidatus Paceibacterota bacterium]